MFGTSGFGDRHAGVTCDGCGASEFSGLRHKCQVCNNYDLCQNCQSGGVTSQNHDTDHPMTLIAPGPSPVSSYSFGGGRMMQPPGMTDWASFATTPSPYSPASFFGAQTYSCPFCGAAGLAEHELAAHTAGQHADDSSPQCCPVCASRPGGNPNYLSRDFHGHMSMRHAKKDEPQLVATKKSSRTRQTARSSATTPPAPGRDDALAVARAAADKRAKRPVVESTPFGRPGDSHAPAASSSLSSSTAAPACADDAALRRVLQAKWLQELLMSTLVDEGSGAAAVRSSSGAASSSSSAGPSRMDVDQKKR